MHLPHVAPFARAPLYFFTACIAGRKPVLACAAASEILTNVWKNSAEHDGWFVGRYVLMPDHVHFFASPAADAKPRAVWCKAWKSISSRHITRALGATPPIWQRDTFDHILRREILQREVGLCGGEPGASRTGGQNGGLAVARRDSLSRFLKIQGSGVGAPRLHQTAIVQTTRSAGGCRRAISAMMRSLAIW
ncbi:MAG: transposase [Opitutaceae bacterium]|nr:transposase [Opitutaceae bacterium]